MDSPDSPLPLGPGDAPIANFSNCHEGIVAHLRTMSELPALALIAERTRQVATETCSFFRNVIYNHHEEEERVLFKAVLASANAGDEFDRISSISDRLTREHREIEARYARIEPDLKKMARGQAANLDPAAIDALVREYGAHAAFEEAEFLPLAYAILSRNSNHMAALGLSLHVRHVTLAPPHV